MAEVVFVDIVLVEISDVCVDIVVNLPREVATNVEVEEVVDLG